MEKEDACTAAVAKGGGIIWLRRRPQHGQEAALATHCRIAYLQASALEAANELQSEVVGRATGSLASCARKCAASRFLADPAYDLRPHGRASSA